MTQTERILEALRANYDGVCSTMMMNEYIMRPAARIGELKAQGHNIETVECPYYHHSHTANVATYRLISNSEQLARLEAAQTAPENVEDPHQGDADETDDEPTLGDHLFSPY